MDPVVARKTWRTLEPIHGMIYFAPEAEEEYVALGLDAGQMGYFASRAAPMGAVPAEVVIATFFNFRPGVVRAVIPEAWSRAAPEAITEARARAADRALRRALGDAVGSDDVVEAAGLARRAALAACAHPEGRPLFAAHTSLPWPDDPHVALWHAQTLLREFRGDAHVNVLQSEGLGALDALVTHAATGELPAEALRLTRGWSPGEWAAAVDSLRSRDLLEPADPLAPSEAGRELRERVERRTDAAARPAYEALGEEACTRLRALGRAVSRAVIDAGLLSPPGGGVWGGR